ncbi:MAG: hypothetical protein OXR66_01980 [Candidatus Woesearchaeota archaeon]|nr:hypothetical protein [Candidatus Woesearchaeota archaeon]
MIDPKITGHYTQHPDNSRFGEPAPQVQRTERQGAQIDAHYNSGIIEITNTGESVTLACAAAARMSGTARDVLEEDVFVRAVNFGGTLYLPRTGVDADVSTAEGNIDGEVACPCSLGTLTGDITLVLRAPLQVQVTSRRKRAINVEGMQKQGNMYRPTDVETRGTLQLQTLEGAIRIRYDPR